MRSMENSEWVGRSIMQATVSALLAGWFSTALYLPTASGCAIEQGVAIAAIFGFSGIAGVATNIAWILAVIFLFLFIASLVM